MRILTRYILGEILSHTLIGCALFTFILFMRDLPHILEMVVRNSSTFTNVIEVFLFTLPNIFKVTIPMAVLVGVLLGLSRLAADSEIIAMRASGLGIGYFVRVASIVAVAGTLLGLGNSLYLAPRANQAILEMEQELETSQASYEIQPRVFYEDFHNFVLYVQDVRAGTGASNWRQVFMADVTDPSTPKITTAASATVVNDQAPGTADAPAQRSRARDRGRPAAAIQHLHLRHHRSPLRPEPAERRPSRTHGYGHLRHAHGTAASSIFTGPTASRYLIELHKRFSYPAACLVLMLVGVPLGVASRRGGKSSGFVFTILLVFLYYFLSSTGIALGRQEQASGISSPCGRPTCSSPPPASFCCGRWPAAAASSTQSPAGPRVLPNRHGDPPHAAQAQWRLISPACLDRLQPRAQRSTPQAASFPASSTNT